MSDRDPLERELAGWLGDRGRRERFLDRLRTSLEAEGPPGVEPPVPPRNGWRMFAFAAALSVVAGGGLWLARSGGRGAPESDLSSEVAGPEVVGDRVLSARTPQQRALRSGRIVVWVAAGSHAVVTAGPWRVDFEPGLGFVETEESTMANGNSRRLVVGVVAGFALVGAAGAEDERRVEGGRVLEASSGDDGEIDVREKVRTLVELLASEDWEAREEASRGLLEIGQPALAALEEAAAGSADLEVRTRAGIAVRSIREDLVLVSILGDLANDRAVAPIVERLRRQPDDPGVVIEVSIVLSGLGRHEEALALIARAIELDPTHAAPYVARGAIRGAGDLSAAIADYETALRLDPGHADAYRLRGVARAAAGHVAAALEDLTRAVELDPARAETYLSRGDLRVRLGDLDAGRADYDRAIALDPSHAGAYLRRGRARVFVGDLESAIADYERAMALVGDQRDADPTREVGEVVTDPELTGAADELQRAIDELRKRVQRDH